eukprot:TRINITY_DN5944_c0_g1_i3.p1 TRINITY_DN5944_c0_g1~~TRINITY_DN5944_c0_g1_i3.p1  ORF type:complete len:131 (-),score=36.93 TRINITY_DN5944_c0_g1_i3:317-709(-)
MTSKERSAVDKLPNSTKPTKNYVHEDRIHEAAVKYEMEKAKNWDRDWGFLQSEYGAGPAKKTHEDYTEEELKKLKSATYAKESEKVGKLVSRGANLEQFGNGDHRLRKLDFYNDRFEVEFDRHNTQKPGQ